MRKSMFREPVARSRMRPWLIGASLAAVAAVTGIGHAIKDGGLQVTWRATLSSLSPHRDTRAAARRSVDVVPLRPRKVETLQEMDSGRNGRTPAVR